MSIKHLNALIYLHLHSITQLQLMYNLYMYSYNLFMNSYSYAVNMSSIAQINVRNCEKHSEAVQRYVQCTNNGHYSYCTRAMRMILVLVLVTIKYYTRIYIKYILNTLYKLTNARIEAHLLVNLLFMGIRVQKLLTLSTNSTALLRKRLSHLHLQRAAGNSDSGDALCHDGIHCTRTGLCNEPESESSRRCGWWRRSSRLVSSRSPRESRQPVPQPQVFRSLLAFAQTPELRRAPTSATCSSPTHSRCPTRYRRPRGELSGGLQQCTFRCRYYFSQKRLNVRQVSQQDMSQEDSV